MCKQVFILLWAQQPRESVAAQEFDVLRRSPSTDKVEEQHLEVNTVESYVAGSSGGCRRGPRLSEAECVRLGGSLSQEHRRRQKSSPGCRVRKCYADTLTE